ncbi:MAG: hypothetical protein RLY86_3661 [Pseudomonadota bacterium]|jgi:carboxyl-terminal processing protease
MNRLLKPPLIALLIAAGLGGGSLATARAEGPVAAVSAEERLQGEHIFALGYSRIAEYFLDPVDLRTLALDGLAGLAAKDPRIDAKVVNDVLRLRVDGRMVGELPLPDHGGPGPWAELTSRAIERLRAHSAPLAALDREATYSVVFDAIVRDLDEYSRYTSAARAAQERSQREGYVGIGLSLRHEGGEHLVVAVTSHSPADLAGVRAGDRILSIDGVAASTLTAQQVGDRLRGLARTSVLLTVGENPQQARRVAVSRDWIVPNMVTAQRDGRTAVLRIERFNAATERDLRDALLSMMRDPAGAPTGYVLDLRGNPGGKLDQAINVADLFMRSGRIVETRGRHPDSMQHFDAAPDDIIDGAPLVVLVDGRSASAAEIVAAALQDSGRAVIVGASSFGKGSIQTVTQLPNEGELFLTWSRFYAPSGYTLHRQGVQPTVCTSKQAGSTNDILLSFVAGGMPPATVIAALRAQAPANEEALARLREACPWKEHDAALDVEVAKTLLATPTLYRRALAPTQTSIAER